VKVHLDSKSIKIDFGKFNTLFTKDIKFILTDHNDNVASKMIPFEVYTPVPQIDFI
jgi:hypothetical protein